MKNPRQTALAWLILVINRGRSVNEVLAKESSELPPQQRALAKQLLFGCLRYYHQLKTITDNLLEKPFKDKDADLALIIILGLYQLKYLSTPDHAAISETVELTKTQAKKWSAGLINGVLRRFQREQTELESALQKSLQFRFSHPGWMVKKLQLDWPLEYQQILTNNNQHAPMILRVNSLKNTTEEYLAKLALTEIKASRHPVAIDALILEKAVDVLVLPGFVKGEVTVQDAAAQLPVELLDLEADLRVLDACAAPGGKTTHILQRQPQLNLVAVEMSASRAERVQQTLQRFELSCELKVADVLDLDNWWDGQLFDRILLDVPCSASGVIRRNPDIKVHRKVTDIKPLIEIQQKILSQCWLLLKTGGVLVYATCSVFKDENQNQIQTFLKDHPAELLQLRQDIHGLLNNRADVGYQILPGEFEMDGFYFCGLKKTV